jgi:hypothetical protein
LKELNVVNQGFAIVSVVSNDIESAALLMVKFLVFGKKVAQTEGGILIKCAGKGSTLKNFVDKHICFI